MNVGELAGRWCRYLVSGCLISVVVQHNLGTLRGQTQTNRPADAARSAGNQRGGAFPYWHMSTL
jgi:hypothetical protein